MKTSLLVSTIFAVTSLVMLSGCEITDFEWDDLDFEFPSTVNPPLGSIVPYVNIDSASSTEANSAALWMSLHFPSDSTLILKNYNINYWESELQNPLILNKVFEVDYDTVDFGLSSAFVFSAAFDSLKAETTYQFCFVGLDYHQSDTMPVGTIYGNCNTFRTSK